ncbi:response regulator transcription factor [Fusibacter bizertensis]
MLNINDFEKINTFKDTIQKNLFIVNKTGSYRKMVSELLCDIFHYNHVIFGYLNPSKDKELSMDVATHKIDHKFLQIFLGSSLFQEKSFFDDEDVIVFSEKNNYTKRRIFKELMTDHNFSDFMLFYLSYGGKKNAFIILFKEGSQGKFVPKDKQIARYLADFLGASYSNYTSYLGLKMTNDLLITQTEYYPIGIIITENFSTASYVNNIAKNYLSELGITDMRYFNVFFSNYILPNVKYELLSSVKNNIIRHKNFIFSMNTTNALSETFYSSLEKASSNSNNLFKLPQNITSIIYIMKDELSSYSKNNDYFNEYSITKKEEAIIDLILLGKSNKLISEELDIRVNTVRVHIQNIYKKFNVSNRTELLFKLNLLK